MTIADLLHSLTAAGLALRRGDGDGDALEVVGEVGKLTPAHKLALNEHKQILLSMLSPPPTCFIQKAADASKSAESGAIIFADSPGALQSLENAFAYFDKLIDDMRRRCPEAMAQVVMEPSEIETPCSRCASRRTYLAVIHVGESLRRDCAKCGRFVSFPVWNNRQEVDELLSRIVMASRYNERRAAQVLEHLSSPNEIPLQAKESANGQCNP